MLIATSYSFLLTSRIWTASPCSMLLVIWLLIFSSLVTLSLLILWRLYVSLVMRSLRLFVFLIIPLLLCRDLGVVSEAFHGLPLHLLAFEVVTLHSIQRALAVSAHTSCGYLSLLIAMPSVHTGPIFLRSVYACTLSDKASFSALTDRLLVCEFGA